jgi:hypothetical protein
MKVVQIWGTLREMGFAVSEDKQITHLGDIVFIKDKDIVTIKEDESGTQVQMITELGTIKFPASEFVDSASLESGLEEFFKENTSNHYGYDYVGFAVGEDDNVTITVSPGNQSGFDIYCPKTFTVQNQSLATLLNVMVLVSNLQQDCEWGLNNRFNMQYRFPDRFDNLVHQTEIGPHWKTLAAQEQLSKQLAKSLSAKILSLA